MTVDNVRVKTTVHRTVFDAASARAGKEDTTVAAVMREALKVYAVPDARVGTTLSSPALAGLTAEAARHNQTVEQRLAFLLEKKYRKTVEPG